MNSVAVCFAHSKCRFLQNWQERAPTLTLCGKQLNVVSSLKYLESLITTGAYGDHTPRLT